MIDTAGIISPVHTEYFYHLKDCSINSLRYWFDNDTEHVNTINYGGGNVLIDVSKLEPGLHNVYLQIVDAAGNLSEIAHRVFYRQMRRDVLTWTYWFDNDEHQMTTLPYSDEGVMIDISELSEGFHTMHNVVNDITQSAVETRMFVKVPQTEGVGYLTCICTVDGHLVSKEKLPLNGGMLQWKMDVDSLDIGVHKAMFQTITPSGAASSIAERYFVREITNHEMGSMKCLYSIDNFKTVYQAGTMSNGLFHFDLNVSDIEDGLHRLVYMLVSDNGITTPQKSAIFWKTPLGGSGITQYEYWLNNSINVHRTTLDKRMNPFSFVSLLPVESEPIRSSCFHFELCEGQPMMYAKNDFHIASLDVSGRRLDESKQYIDYNVSQPVTDITLLEATQTFACPGVNEVKWFTFEAEYGDSIALKSNQATSIQVFDATGKEVYATSADQSVKYGGCHLLTNGTCYVAVHDVTGTGSNVMLNVQFIDKFAVFEYTPSRFASSGKTLMTFKGNGLEYVKKVELTNGETTFLADTIIATTDQMMARFSLDEEVAASQLYTLNLYFQNVEIDESKILSYKDGVALEPVNNVPLMRVEIVTETRVGDPYPIKVTIRNEGNVPQYGIPINIAFDNVDKFDELLFNGFELLLSDSLYNCRDFCIYTDNLVGTGKNGFFLPLIIPYMGPNEIRTYTFGVRTKIPHAKFNFYAWAGRPWCQLSMKMRSQQNSNMHDVYDVVDIVDNVTDLPVSPTSVVRPFLGAGEAIAGIVQGSTRARENAVFDAYGIDPSERDQYSFQFNNSVRSPRDIAADVLGLPELGDVAEGSEPNPTPHPVDVYLPGDPNEMTGYSAPSGSCYMKDDVGTIGYDIEFENDPEIANSAAHCIVIENQLDPTKFDLKTFTPKDITLSGKKLELDGSKSFVQTLDLRPKIDAIAELQCSYNIQTGFIRWTFTSLDPMSMEPTNDIMQGVLPVNYDGTSGIGNVTYTVDLLKTFPDGTEISNKASIIFDNNDAIETPLWVNTIDAMTPSGMVYEAVLKNDSTATVHCSGSDERSGVWKYDVYVQYGSGNLWEKVGECLADSAYLDFPVYEGMDYGFCALAVDSAGNVETKELVREASLASYVPGDANMDSKVDMEDVVTAVNYYLGLSSTIHLRAADVVKDDVIDMEDAVAICNTYLGTTVSSLRMVKQRLRNLRLPNTLLKPQLKQ